MKKSRFTDNQIMDALKRIEADQVLFGELFFRPCTTRSSRWWVCSVFRTILRWRFTSRF